jgi:hypothetical protein
MNKRDRACDTIRRRWGITRTLLEVSGLEAQTLPLFSYKQPLRAYAWSSYGHYVQTPAKRPEWLRVDHLLGEMGIPQDSVAGRRRFERGMEERRGRDEPVLKTIAPTLRAAQLPTPLVAPLASLSHATARGRITANT